MEITDRFGRLWERWDEAVKTRADVPAFLDQAKDEELVQLLAAFSDRDRKYERDVVATEVLNRLHRRQRTLPGAAAAVLDSAEAAYEAAAAGQMAIHAAEGILKANGEKALGTAVSASAYASLDTTRLAFEAAKKNSADVRSAVSQSRIADQLAEDAVKVARETTDATRDAADQLAHSGHDKQAAAAHAAAERIEEATEATREAVKEERRVEGER